MLKVLTDDSSDHVDQPLLGHFRQVNVVRQISVNLVLVSDVLENLLNREVLVLRYVQRLDVVVVDIALAPRQDVLQEEDGDIL